MNTEKTFYIDDTMLASRGQRFANFILDLLMQFIIAVLLGVVATVLAYVFNADGLLIWIDEMDGLQERLIGILIMLTYYVPFEALTGRTVGKYITKTKVVMEDGSLPPAGTVFIRSLCRILFIEALSFLGNPPRGWHDSASKTYVVDAKKYDEALRLKNSFDEIGKPEII